MPQTAYLAQDDSDEIDYDDPATFGIGDEAPEYTPERVMKMVKAWDHDIDLRRSKWRAEARVCFALVAGDQWDSEDKSDLIDAMRVPVVFNRVEPMVDAVTGAQIANRQEMAFFAREVGDAQASELIGAAIDQERDACSAEDEESEAARDALICGMGWMEERLDQEDDPKGAIVWEHVDTFEMDPDPFAKKKNVVDARYVRRRREYSPEEFRDFKKQIGEIGPDDYSTEGAGGDRGDGKPKNNEPHDAYNPDDDDDVAGDLSPRKSYTVREYQWMVRHVAEDSDWRVSDPMTGKSTVLSAQQYQQIASQFMMRGMTLQGRAIPKRCIYRVYICGEKVLGQGAHRLPGVTSFTYKAITGKRDRANKSWYGIIRSMIDPQRFVNALFSQILHIIDSSAKGGVWYEESAILNPDEFEGKWAEVAANIAVADGAISENRIKSRAELNFPAGYDRLLSFVWESFPWVTGVNPNLFGMASEAGESGILDAQRTRQAYGVLQWFFAAIRRYTAESGKLALELLAHIDQGKLVRVVRGDQRQYVPLAYDGDVKKYDIVIDEAADSPSQKERTFGIMMELAPIFKALGLPLPPDVAAEMVRHSPLPASMNEKLAAGLTKPDPAAEQMKQLSVADAQAKVQKTSADAQLSGAKAQSEVIKAQTEVPLAQLEAQIKLEELQVRKVEAQVKLAELEVQRASIPLEMERLQSDAAVADSRARADIVKAQSAERVAREPKPKTAA